VGAPTDTLLAGRSRAAYFALLTSDRGRLLVIEPDPMSVAEFRAWLRRRELHHVTVVSAGAWSRPGELRLFVDDAHPATNFTAGTTEYDAARQAEFREVTVDATTIDEVIGQHDAGRVDLLSITTNGAEIEILAGAANTIDRYRPMVCLARTHERNLVRMRELGYETVAAGDRGYTFVWSHS